KQPVIVAHDLIFPNGMAMTGDGKLLLVAETFAGRISVFKIDSDGLLSDRRIWAKFASRKYESVPAAVASGEPLPAGIALDTAGSLWIADAGGRGAVLVAEGGRILRAINTGNLSVYAVALGGPDRRTLFMCAAPPLLSYDPTADSASVLLTSRVDTP